MAQDKMQVIPKSKYTTFKKYLNVLKSKMSDKTGLWRWRFDSETIVSKHEEQSSVFDCSDKAIPLGSCLFTWS